MISLKKFDINAVSTKLNRINANISITNNVAFPCLNLLSNYRFTKRFVKILPNGDIQGGYAKMIISLIDFSFVRSLTASCYHIKSPPAYDPPSLFLLELFRYIDRHQNMDKFLEVLRDKNRGSAYRTYAGIFQDHIPTKGTFSHFKARLGARLYNEIFHVLVTIFEQLQMITFKILSHDGTLFPTRAKYKGCHWFSDKCTCIEIKDVIARVKHQILYRLNNLQKINLEKVFKIKGNCPYVPEGFKKKPPRMEVLSMNLVFADEKPSQNQIHTAMLFGVKEQLDKNGLVINTIRSNLSTIDFCSGHAICRCPKIPKDTDARVGVRRDPQNSNKKQRIFGYNLVLSTSVEIDLKLELPVAATNIAGNAEEGDILIVNNEQIASFHKTQTYADIADAKYDITKNYQYLRDKGSIPIIDYNRRRENVSSAALHARGYDTNGWPYAPCGLITRSNGFDKKSQRHTFSCFKQCLKLKARGIINLQDNYDIGSCRYIENRNGYSRHMYIKDQPRLQNQIPRGTNRYNAIKRTRSASERANSTIKEDIKIIDKPIVYNKDRADILTQIAAIVLLIHRAMAFIARTTILLQQCADSNDPEAINKIIGPPILKSIRSLIQLE